MKPQTHTNPDERRNFRRHLRRLPGYTLRSCIAAVATVIMCFAAAISLPFALFDLRGSRRRKSHPQIRGGSGKTGYETPPLPEPPGTR